MIVPKWQPSFMEEITIGSNYQSENDLKFYWKEWNNSTTISLSSLIVRIIPAKIMILL